MLNDDAESLKSKLKRRKDHLHLRLKNAKTGPARYFVKDGMPVEKIVSWELDMCKKLIKQIDDLLLIPNCDARNTNIVAAIKDAEWFLFVDYDVAANFKDKLLLGILQGRTCHNIDSEEAVHHFKYHIIDGLFIRTKQTNRADFNLIVKKWINYLKGDNYISNILWILDNIKIPEDLDYLYTKYKE